MFHYSIPCELIFGAGSLKELGKSVRKTGGSKVFMVCDQGVERAGIVAKAEAELLSEGITYEIFNEVLPNPTVSVIEAAAKRAKACGCGCIVAIGGGSSMDTAKAVNILMNNEGSITDYEGPDRVQKSGLPLIAIPTTSGTGSEVTSVSVVTDPVRKRKMVIAGQNVGACLAIADPELTLGLPAKITAATGMDALTHAMEAYMSTLASPATDVNALKAVELICKSLPVCVREPKNLEARSDLMLGSTLAGFAFNSAILGIAHAIAHPLGAYFGVAHGDGNAIALPYAVEYNAEVIPGRVVEMGRAMGLLKADLTAGDVVDALKSLAASIHIPGLSDCGVTEKDFDTLVPAILAEPSCLTNPRPVTEEGVRDILSRL